jgi:hypothetical protein
LASLTSLVIPAKHAVAGGPTSDRVKPIAAIVAAKANPATIRRRAAAQLAAARPTA